MSAESATPPYQQNEMQYRNQHPHIHSHEFHNQQLQHSSIALLVGHSLASLPVAQSSIPQRHDGIKHAEPDQRRPQQEVIDRVKHPETMLSPLDSADEIVKGPEGIYEEKDDRSEHPEWLAGVALQLLPLGVVVEDIAADDAEADAGGDQGGSGAEEGEGVKYFHVERVALF
ncbi:hypothetical protein BDZ85DRAFT_265146 [Elsinoe ampelina]|uniref:Uncharacterized protein n=1 Tax=Elsinoe ampelina TaxID=302913 RepID=A0A6A6G6H7_9PEZI|nr:hypothetical protein BDZ85DRAFT_265146 [Elsinoe ampelina]